jgi:hypothetical protein
MRTAALTTWRQAQTFLGKFGLPTHKPEKVYEYRTAK